MKTEVDEIKDETKVDIKVAIATATELKPGAKYLICIDREKLSDGTVDELARALGKAGFVATIALMIDGDPNTAVKVIEEP